MDIKALEADAKAMLDKAIAGLKAVQGFESVKHLEDAFPAAKHLAERLLSAVPIISELEEVADVLAAGYAFAQAIGLKPMDANDIAKADEKFHPGYSAD